MRKLILISAAALAVAGGVAATQTAARAATCTIQIGGACGGYSYGPNVMSNGYNLYVEDQGVGPQAGTTATATVTDPGNWSVTANEVPYGDGGVQTFNGDQQLMNNWCTDNSGWQSVTNCSTQAGSTPYSGVSSLAVNYSETSPQDANSIYEYAADTWPTNYGSDIMFWTDTHGRCNEGSYGSTILAPLVTIDGQAWTLNRYGGPGAELIWVLDSNPAVPDSCASQPAGTIDIKAAYDWMNANGIVPAGGGWNEVDAGWEITSADSTTFTVSSYSVTGTVAGSPSPSPSPTATSPSPSPTSTSPAPSPSPSPTCTPRKHGHCH